MKPILPKPTASQAKPQTAMTPTPIDQVHEKLGALIKKSKSSPAKSKRV